MVKYIVFYTSVTASYLRAEANLKATAVNKNAEKGSIGDRCF